MLTDIKSLLLGITFGGLMICAVLTGLVGIAYVIGALLMNALPGITTHVRAFFKWDTYKMQPAIGPLNLAPLSHEYPPPPVSVVDATPTLAYSREFLRLPPDMRELPGGRKAYKHARVCTNCGKERKFFSPNGLCFKCSPQPQQAS